jgi:drug/metabolite transporter (DMT)-like permease
MVDNQERNVLPMTPVAWLIFIGAAILEVGGDAMIRKGLQKTSLVFIISGVVVLGGYGLVVNIVKWDFSKLLGVYVAIFAIISVLFGVLVFKENMPISTWVGLALIVGGGMVIQFGGQCL